MRVQSGAGLLALLVACSDDGGGAAARLDASQPVGDAAANGDNNDASAVNPDSSSADPPPSVDAMAKSDAPAPATDGAAPDAMLQCRPTGACSPLVPGECGALQACRTAAQGTVCRPLAAAAKGENQPCKTSEECAEGLLCFDLGQGTGGACQKLCPANVTGFCGATAACAISISGEPCLRICVPLDKPCNIYDQKTCPAAGQKCGLARNPETGDRYTGCIAAGAGQPGAACTGDSQCSAGTICINVAGASTCRQVCGPNNSAPLCTQPGQICSGRSMRYDVGFCQ